MLRLRLTARLTVLLLSMLFSPFVADAQLVRIQNSTLPFIADRHPVAKPAPGRTMQISVALQISKRPELDALIEQLYDPTSANFRHFLTRSEFVGQFGPDPLDYSAVIHFLRKNGLRVTATYANRMLIDAEGTVAQIERAFDVVINIYAAENGRTFNASDRDPALPAAVASIVASIAGLDDYGEMKSHAIASPRQGALTALGIPAGFTPGQIATAYNFAPMYRSGVDGAGATLAIATAFGFRHDDVNAFWQNFGIATPNYSIIAVGGKTAHSSLETTLDLEQAGALARGATILVYEAASAKFSTFQSVYNRIVSDNRASVATTSWGICEQQMPQAVMEADSGIFAEAAAQGQAWFASSGDNGAYDCGNPDLAVDYPASDPNVTSANGTSLALNSANAISAEWAWRGSGGGLSAAFAQPFYQSGPSLVNSFSNGMRQAADVAFNADPLTGYPVLYQNKWTEFGGTSFSAPAWAAIFTLVNAARADKGPVGSASPNLYALMEGSLAQPYAAFHDIVDGNNSYYPAIRGWDYASGWGSPDVANLVADLE